MQVPVARHRERAQRAEGEARVDGEPHEDVLEDAVVFAGVSKYPARIKCALLGWMAWKDATAQAIAQSDADGDQA